MQATTPGLFGIDDFAIPKEFGQYEILGEIARGAMSVVYRVKQRGLDRVVALKVLQGGASASPEQLQRFMQEAHAAARIQHPNIVPIHDFGVQGGQHYFTMDYIAGESLAERLAKGPLPVREALEIVRQAADALQYAHEHNVVHRDIKPGNILLDKTGHVKVTDFGVAKEMDHTEMHLTATGQMIGTPQYMSPEQASGRSAHVDQRSDIFSLGVTLYEMLTGRPAFLAESMMQMLHKVCHDDPPPPHQINSRVHRDAATICLKAIEKEPARRYQTARAMAQDIEHFLAGEPIEAKTAGPWRRRARKLSRFVPLIAANLLLAALAVAGLRYYLRSRPCRVKLDIARREFDVTLDDQTLPPEQFGTILTIPAGKHHVRVAAEPEFDPQEFDFTIKPAESQTFHTDLVRRMGQLIVTADPPDAGITILGVDGYRLPLRGPRAEQELPTGQYTVLVSRDNYLAHGLDIVIEPRATNSCRVTLEPVGVWAAPTAASIQSVPVVADVDNSDQLAAVVGDNAGNVYCVAARSGVVKWVHQVGDAVQAPVAATGTNVFVATTAGKLFCLAGDDGHEIWPKPFEAAGPVFGAIILRDVNGDGQPDAIIAGGEGAVYAVSGATGSGLWTNTADGRIESCVALGRVGTNEFVLVGNADGMLTAIGLRRGESLWNVATETPLLLPPSFAELAGQPCVLLPTPKTPGDERTMTAVALTTHKVTGVSAEFPRQLDLAGTGQPQKIVVTDDGTTCYDATGTNQLWRSDYLAIGAYTADLDGDGTLDLVFNSGPAEIVALSGRDGTVLGHIMLDAPTGRGFTLDDVDGDGNPDIVVGVAQYLRCFSLAGGRKCWSGRSTGYFDAPFATVAGRFVTKDNAGEIACYDPQLSAPVWRAATSPQPAPYFGVAASADVVVDADANSRLVRAFAAVTGQVLWQTRLNAETTSIGAPAAGDGLAIVSDGIASVRAFTLTNGAPQWAVRLPGVTTAPTIGGGRVIVTGMNDLYATVTCLTATNGQTLWRTGFSDPVPTPPVLVDLNGDGIPDVLALCDNGIIYALDGRDGATLWLYRHSERHTHTRNGIVVAGMQGFFATSAGEVIGLNLKTGQPTWTRRFKESILGRPALADINGRPVVLVGTMKGRVHCLSSQTGAELWSYEAGAPIRYGAPLAVKNPNSGAPLVIVGTGPPENGLYCLRGDCPRAKDRGWTGHWKDVAGQR